MNINQELLEIEEKNKILIDKARSLMSEVPDPKHSVSHMEAVVKYTKEILQNGVEANKEICIISAYWHDVGRKISEEGHAIRSANLLKEEMEQLNYDKEFIEKCYLAIHKHGWNEMPETIEGIIIRDADKIDFVGINRWKECIENNCIFKKILELLPTMRDELLELECSRKIFDREIGKLVTYLHNIIFKID